MINKWIRQRWERTSDNRYYEAILQKDLLDTWVIVRVWGGINKATGGIKTTPVPGYQEGIQALLDIEKARSKKVYRPKLRAVTNI